MSGLRSRLDELRYGGINDDSGEVAMGNVGVDPFLSEIEEIKNSINQVEEKVELMKTIHGEMLTRAVSPEHQRQELEQLRNFVSTTSISIHKTIERLKTRISKEPTQTAEHRIHKAQHSALVKKFHAVMESYNNEQENFKGKSKDKISRQLKILGKEKTQEEITEMIERGDPNVFTNDLIGKQVRSREALSEIQQRHQDILNLEKDINELQEIFRDLAMLIEEQGDTIDNIENQVETAAEYTKRAQKEIASAHRYKQSSRKKIWIIVCIVSSVAIVLFLLIIIAVIIAVVITR